MSERPLISVVSPVYRAEAIVPELVRRLVDALEPLGEFEIVLVEDRSPDASWAAIRAASEKDPRVRGIRLSRNFGQQRATRAGLDAARGDFVVVIDCDLQDDPAYIPRLLAACRAGHDVIYTTKTPRKHSGMRNLAARMYYWLFNYLIGDEAHVAQMGIGSYSMLSRRVVLEYRRWTDASSHYLIALRSLGFEHTVVETEHSERFAGKSSYTWSRLARHAADGLVSQSARLLNVSIAIGITFCVTAFLGAIGLTVRYFVRGAAQGWTSVIVMQLLMTGLMMLSIGILGLYIGRIFEQVKGRPLYVVDERLNEPPLAAETQSGTASSTAGEMGSSP